MPDGEERQYLERVKENPGDAEAHFILGYISYWRGDNPAAIACYLDSKKTGFGDPNIHYRPGRS